VEFPLTGGHGDPPLSAEGVAQAEKVGARLAGEHIDALYVTTLVRTHQTAAPLARATGLVPAVEADLREVHLGEWEGGRFRQMVAEGHPLALRMAAEERWDAVPGAEPAEVFAARIRAGIERIAAAHPDQRVVAVVHGGVIGEILRQASGSRAMAFSAAENASISQIVVTADRWVVRRYNDVAHLSSHFATESSPLT